MKRILELAAALCSVASWAAVHVVSPGESIQGAVTLAIESDTVLILDGTYTESIVPYGKNVTIGSQYLMDGDTSHISRTIVFPDDVRPDTGSCFVYGYGETDSSRLSGLTIRNGYGTLFEGTYFSDRYGGAVFVCNSRLRMDHCIVFWSSAYHGGGIALISYPLPAVARLSATAVTVRQCFAYGYGGGLNTYDSEAILTECWIDQNGSGLEGGGACFGPGRLTLQSCLITRNCGTVGGLFIIDNEQASLLACRFSENALNYSGYADLFVADGQASIVGCRFESSALSADAIGLFEQTPGSRIDFVGNVVQNYNLVLGSGQVVLDQYVLGDFAYNTLRGNFNESSSPVYVLGWMSNARIHHNAFINNATQWDNCGSAITVLPTARATLDSNWFEGNSGVLIAGLDTDCRVDCTLHAEHNWWGHATGPYQEMLNPGGHGDTLCSDDHVLFTPWLTAPPDTSMPEGYLGVAELPEIPQAWKLADVYPNPFNSSITLVLAGFTGNDFDISLYNLLGQQVDVVHRGALTGGQLVYQAPPWLASGVYLLSAKDKHSIQTKKVVLLK